MKVGDYVRTKDGVIAKITDIIEDLSIDCDRDVFDLDNMAMMEIPWYCKEKYIIKSSSNIIDLIEVGDYVNGSKVVRIEEHNEELYVYVQETEYCNACLEEENIYYKEDTIKSILTKEQFESMEYKV